jgi:hypothetical protein
MRSVFEIGFRNNFRMGQLDIVVAAIPALISGGVSVWGGLQQEKIAKMQKKAAEVQSAQQAAQQAAQDKAQAAQAQSPAAAPAAAGAAGGGISSTALIVGGVGLAAVLGAVVVMVASKGGAAPAA